MKLPTVALLAPFSLLLAACGGPDHIAENATAEGAIIDSATPDPGLPPPSDGSRPANAVAVPGPQQADIRIPAFLHGRWGLTPEDCTSTRGDAKGLLVISADELRFYESRAHPVGSVNSSDTSFSADYSFSGEGQTWSSFQTLQLQDRRLVRTTSSPMASYTYAKCD